MGQSGCGFIGALEKRKENGIWISSLPHHLIGKNELLQLRAIECLLWSHGAIAVSFKRRVTVGVEDGLLN
jgi:hypothetical protein